MVENHPESPFRERENMFIARWRSFLAEGNGELTNPNLKRAMQIIVDHAVERDWPMFNQTLFALQNLLRFDNNDHKLSVSPEAQMNAQIVVDFAFRTPVRGQVKKGEGWLLRDLHGTEREQSIAYYRQLHHRLRDYKTTLQLVRAESEPAILVPRMSSPLQVLVGDSARR